MKKQEQVGLNYSEVLRVIPNLEPSELTELARFIRFWEKINKTETCWLWTASTRGSGYGCFRFNGRTESANRVSWIIHNGEIPDGLLVLHKCDVPSCVNPDHLYLGDFSQNMKDAWERGHRLPPTPKLSFDIPCPKGHTNRFTRNKQGKRKCLECHRIAAIERRKIERRQV